MSSADGALATDDEEEVRREFVFRLPTGFVDEHGVGHRDGCMRRATAYDEVVSLGDERVRANPAYLSVLLLARVVTRLGAVEEVGTHVIERLFASDIGYLQQLYQGVNGTAPGTVEAECPRCGHAVGLPFGERPEDP